MPADQPLALVIAIAAIVDTVLLAVIMLKAVALPQAAHPIDGMHNAVTVAKPVVIAIAQTLGTVTMTASVNANIARPLVISELDN